VPAAWVYGEAGQGGWGGDEGGAGACMRVN
jgi:hypothetical protein